MDGSGGVFGSGKITCRWFNMPFIHKLVATGQEVVVYGKVKDSNGRLIIDHPEFEVLREDDPEAESIHLERIVPIYRNIAGLAQRRLREIMHLLLLQADPGNARGSLRGGSAPSRGPGAVAGAFPRIARTGARRPPALRARGVFRHPVERRLAAMPPSGTNRAHARQTHRLARRVLPEPALRSNRRAEALDPRDHRRHAGSRVR